MAAKCPLYGTGGKWWKAVVEFGGLRVM